MPIVNISALKLFVFQVIPMPVLYGVFLYMGCAALRGMQVSRTIPGGSCHRNNVALTSMRRVDVTSTSI